MTIGKYNEIIRYGFVFQIINLKNFFTRHLSHILRILTHFFPRPIDSFLQLQDWFWGIGSKLLAFRKEIHYEMPTRKNSHTGE